jgi:hypothetical protein
MVAAIHSRRSFREVQAGRLEPAEDARRLKPEAYVGVGFPPPLLDCRSFRSCCRDVTRELL